jgi:hypothetical protein
MYAYTLELHAVDGIEHGDCINLKCSPSMLSDLLADELRSKDPAEVCRTGND